MNKSLFNTLFHYKGEISNKTFFRGTLAILFCVFAALNIYLFAIYQTMFIAELGSRSLARWSYIQQLTDVFHPQILPIKFIIFYSTIVLTLKRSRYMGFRKFWGIVSGLFIFHFFVSLLSIPLYYIGINEFNSNPELNLLGIFKNSAIVNGITAIIGFILILYFAIAKPSKESKSSLKLSNIFNYRGKITDHDFASHMGLLYIINLVLSLVLFGIIILITTSSNSPQSHQNFFISFLVLIYVIISSTLFISLCMQRFRDIGYKGGWVPILFLLFVLIFVVFGIITRNSTNEDLIFSIMNILSFSLLIFYSLQFLLFIVPTKKKVENNE